MDEADAVLAANERYYAAFNQHDIGAMDVIWARQAPVSCTHPGWLTLTGRDEVMESWSAILANPGQGRIVPGGAAVTFLGDGVAVVHCREFVSGTPLVATNLFVREDGLWRIADHHASPVLV